MCFFSLASDGKGNGHARGHRSSSISRVLQSIHIGKNYAVQRPLVLCCDICGISPLLLEEGLLLNKC